MRNVGSWPETRVPERTGISGAEGTGHAISPAAMPVRDAGRKLHLGSSMASIESSPAGVPPSFAVFEQSGQVPNNR